MSNFTASIRHGFSNLTNFEGRDRPRQFWPYALLLIATQWLVGTALAVPMMIDAMKSSFAAVGEAARAGGPVDQLQLQADMMQQIMAQTQAILPYTLGLNILVALLLVAATVRRLHDRDWSGWWVLLAVGSLLTSIVSSYWVTPSSNALSAIVPQSLTGAANNPEIWPTAPAYVG